MGWVRSGGAVGWALLGLSELGETVSNVRIAVLGAGESGGDIRSCRAAIVRVIRARAFS